MKNNRDLNGIINLTGPTGLTNGIHGLVGVTGPTGLTGYKEEPPNTIKYIFENEEDEKNKNNSR